MKSDLRTAVEDSRLASHLYARRSLFDKKGCIRYNKRKKERAGKGGRPMNLWHDISPERMQPEDFLVVIEIEKGSKNKYELDKQTGALRLDRILYTSTHYPANYGFIPRTYADDGDPLDVLVLCSEPIRPMSLVRVYPVGYFTMRDNGAMDDKILAIPFGDPMFNGYSALSDLPAHVSNEISHFFSVYKHLEPDTNAEVDSVHGREEAITVIMEAFAAYRRKFNQ
jgi:inorganic diphosphatase